MRSTGSCEPSVTWKTVGSKSCVAVSQHLFQILVASAAEAHEHERLVELARPRQRMCRLESGDDPLAARELAKGLQRLLVGRANVLGAAAVAQRGVLGPDAG